MAQQHGVVEYLADYCAAIDYRLDQELSDGTWLFVPCPLMERHEVACPIPTFAVNLISGSCRCHVCGLLGDESVMIRSMREYIPTTPPPASRRREDSLWYQAPAEEANVSEFIAEQKQFYRNSEGKPYMVVLSEPKAGVPPGTISNNRYAYHDGELWLWGAGQHRALYRTELLCNAADKDAVFVVNGEHVADELQKAIDSASRDRKVPDAVATTWLGGPAAWRSIRSWDMMENTRVILWPDNNPIAMHFMKGVATRLLDVAKDLWFVIPAEPDLPANWNAAHCIETGRSPFDAVSANGRRVSREVVEAWADEHRHTVLDDEEELPA